MSSSTHSPRAREYSRLVAHHLAAAGAARGWTKAQVAAAAGVTPGQLSYYLAGTRGLMTVGSLVQACEKLGIEPRIIATRAYEDLVREFGPAERVSGPGPGVVVPVEPRPTPRAGTGTSPSVPRGPVVADVPLPSKRSRSKGTSRPAHS